MRNFWDSLGKTERTLLLLLAFAITGSLYHYATGRDMNTDMREGAKTLKETKQSIDEITKETE